jgi:hypothetical protein
MPRNLVYIGWGLALFGLLSGFASIFVPWLRLSVVVGSGRRAQNHLEKVPVLNLSMGLWYVLLLLTLVAIVGTAAMGQSRGRNLAGVTGPILSVVTAGVVVAIITTTEGTTDGPGRVVDTAVAAGGWLGFASLPMLGFACGLIAIGRARTA